MPNEGTLRTRRVCVVGAGMSGLRAAGLLTSQGFEVTILEARNRIGGRVNQASLSGLPLDLGASWIHGTDGNPFVGLAEKIGTTTVSCGAVHSIFDIDGQYIDRNMSRCLYEKVWDILSEASKYSRAHYSEIPIEATLKEYVSARVEALFAQEDKRQSQDQKRLLNLIVEMWGAFMGAEYESQSLKNLWLDQGVEGDNLFVASTFESILEEIARPALLNARIHLNSEVLRVETIYNCGSSPTCRSLVTTRAGFQETFEHVIITAPLGWLKRNQDIFTPRFPPQLAQSIDDLGFGNLEKVFIRFPKAFWNETQQVDKQVSFPIESLFLSPEYAPETNPQRYRQEIISFSGLPRDHAQPVIMFFTYGAWGRYISSLISGKSQVSQEFYKILDTHFRPYYARLPHFDPESPDCLPERFLATQWSSDEFAGWGSFCNFPVGLEDGALNLEILRQGMGRERGIWFAGEHVAPSCGIGTVMGAYQSCEFVARRIAECYGL